ncbi:protease inhibitor I42 family protein [Streptomyces rubellomurinus]|uniref:protease inhibitor I42 family protein n=1 Tax=Streptomyces rubellomurinus (strain ATCC 31215) TaxID=359131 RepID=UPI00099B4FFA|nr:protease inhibitor I42 family protein [Streptomyces rubellomurinus]
MTPLTRTPLRAVALIAVLAACLAASASNQPDRGRILGPDERSVTLTPGDRFSIAVEDNASIGDDWSIVDPRADTAVVAAVDQVTDYPPGYEKYIGGGGTAYYIFEAKGRGTTTITLHNCFRICDDPEIGKDVYNTYTVTVR